MHAVMATWAVPPGTREEMVESLNINVIPFIKTLPGFISARFAYDPAGGFNHTYLVFADEECARRFVTVTAEQRLQVQRDAGVSRTSEFIVVDVLAQVEPENSTIGA